jgi:hypothetical protein
MNAIRAVPGVPARHRRIDPASMAAMRSDLDHLPPAKQREFERVVQIRF